MDCLKAQQVISDALDRSAIDRLELAQAKEHCRACPDCGAFVRGLLAVQRTPVPSPPADLADRIIGQIRDEAQRTAVAKARAVAARADNAASAAVPGIEPRPLDSPTEERARTIGDLVRLAAHPRYRRSVAIWAGTAAVLFVFAGWAAIAGVRTILIPSDTGGARLSASTADSLGSAESLAAPDQRAQMTSEGAAARTAEDLAFGEPQFIAVDGTAYRYEGTTSGVDLRSLAKVGETRSALDSSQLPSNRDVLGSPGGERLYIEDAGRVLSFLRVSRSFDGRTYLLRTAAIDSFGMWPSTPLGVPRPKSADGAPEYVEAGTGPGGVIVYRRATGGAEEGIAIAPNAPASDPVAGSPDWTWWTPAETPAQ